MPELPEVECLTRAVAEAAQGWRLRKANFYREDLRDPIPVKAFKKSLEGKTLEKISRRSKYMIWETSSHCGLFHLGMSGKMLEFPDAKPRENHTHAVFTVEDQSGEKRRYLHFIDPRRFGRIALCSTTDMAEHVFFANLGPEPLITENLGEHLYSVSRGRKAPIKNFVMDATVVVGVGNMYASESLFRTGIRPTKAAQSVKAATYDQLALNIKEVLSEAILAGGTSFRDYCHADGTKGEFEMRLAVYGRKKQACLRCTTPIAEVRLAGRSSFYCPKCQQ